MEVPAVHVHVHRAHPAIRVTLTEALAVHRVNQLTLSIQGQDPAVIPDLFRGELEVHRSWIGVASQGKSRDDELNAMHESAIIFYYHFFFSLDQDRDHVVEIIGEIVDNRFISFLRFFS